MRNQSYPNLASQHNRINETQSLNIQIVRNLEDDIICRILISLPKGERHFCNIFVILEVDASQTDVS